MDIRFTLKRVLGLIAIVILLSFVYFMVRVGYSANLDSLENPARLKIGELSAMQAQEKKTGWLVLEDPEDPLSLPQRDSVELALKSLGYTPTYSSTVSRQQLDAATEGVIITATELGNLGQIESLMAYAQSGGVLVFAIRPEVDDTFRSIYQRLGIYEHGYFIESRGLNLEAGLLTKEPYVVEGDWLYNSAIALHVEQYCHVYATNDDGVPLIWSMPNGQGQILFMNNSLMTRKATGGLLVSLLARLKGPMLYPVINARAVALEYFPLPSNINGDFLRQVYLRSGQAFLRDVWWSEMVRFSRSKDIPLTTGFLTGYDSEDPFSISSSALSNELDLLFYAKELVKYGGEIGFTGFSQKPLFFGQLPENMQFDPWSGTGIAAQRTGEALEFFGDQLPFYGLYAYLPPERMLDQDGYEIIRQRIPELQVICGDFYDRQLWYQDFDVDENGIASFPIVTDGFTPTYEDEWNLLCVANAFGVVFHACDVTDLLMETDPDNSWNVISKGFFDFSDEILTETSHLDGMTVTEASWRLRQMLELNAEVQVEGDRVNISIPNANMPEKAYFMLHCSGKQPLEAAGISIKKISEGRYFITSTIPFFTLELVNV